MSKKHLTYDEERLFRQGSRRDLRWPRSLRTSAKIVRPLAERLKSTEGWSPLPMATTVSTIRPVPGSQNAAQAATGESASARLPAEDVRRVARSTGKEFCSDYENIPLCLQLL